jgi:hypothetical protein
MAVHYTTGGTGSAFRASDTDFHAATATFTRMLIHVIGISRKVTITIIHIKLASGFIAAPSGRYAIGNASAKCIIAQPFTIGTLSRDKITKASQVIQSHKGWVVLLVLGSADSTTAQKVAVTLTIAHTKFTFRGPNKYCIIPYLYLYPMSHCC